MSKVEGELQEKKRNSIEYSINGETFIQKFEEWKVLTDRGIKKFVVAKHTEYVPGDYVSIEYIPIPNYISYYDFLYELYKKTKIKVKTGGIIASGISRRVRNAKF